MSNIIHVEHVSMQYRLSSDLSLSLKERAISILKRTHHYNTFMALNDVSFSVGRGEVVGIIGRNGSGKSTILKIICGILKPTAGRVECLGNVAPMLELGSGFDHSLTGRENIYLNGAVLGYGKAYLNERFNEIIEFSELGAFINEPIRNYSSGMLMRLAFSIATVVKPDILIADEILSVGDTSFREKSQKRMQELMAGGTTVLLVSHSLEQIRQLCDRVIWLEKGEIVMIGETSDVCNQYKL